MLLLIFAIVAIGLAIVLILMVDAIPGLAPPVPVILRIIILLVAIVAIANRAGFI